MNVTQLCWYLKLVTDNITCEMMPRSFSAGRICIWNTACSTWTLSIHYAYRLPTRHGRGYPYRDAYLWLGEDKSTWIMDKINCNKARGVRVTNGNGRIVYWDNVKWLQYPPDRCYQNTYFAFWFLQIAIPRYRMSYVQRPERWHINTNTNTYTNGYLISICKYKYKYIWVSNIYCLAENITIVF